MDPSGAITHLPQKDVIPRKSQASLDFSQIVIQRSRFFIKDRNARYVLANDVGVPPMTIIIICESSAQCYNESTEIEKTCQVISKNESGVNAKILTRLHRVTII